MAESLQNPSVYEQAKEAVSFLQGRLPACLQRPQVAIVCGSGLGGLADTIHNIPRAEYDYTSIPHFPRLTGKSIRSVNHLLLVLGYVPYSRSCWTCRKTGFRAACSDDPSCLNGWPCTVRRALFESRLVIIVTDNRQIVTTRVIQLIE